MSEKKEKVDIKVSQKYLVKGESGGMFGGTYPEYFEKQTEAEEFARLQSFVSGKETLVYCAVAVAEAEVQKSTTLKKM